MEEGLGRVLARRRLAHGAHPRDEELFAAALLPILRAAAEELSWLRRRGYPAESALKLVGDRHQLRERQRAALSRATSEAATADERAARRAAAGTPPPTRLLVDGFNQVITVEVALAGGVLVTTADGGLRDLAGIHGTWRRGPGTRDALLLLAARLRTRGWGEVPARWLLDAPVSNSGRLAEELRAVAAAESLPWEAEVVPDPDPLLAAAGEGEVVCSGDAPVLDRCRAWLDLAAEAARELPTAWIVDLFPA